jgi:hypothetical protein
MIMNKTRQLLAFMLILGAGLIGGSITERMNYTVPTAAQRPERPPVRTPERWDYCALSKAAVGASRGGLYSITYFRDGGAQVVEAEELATERYGPARAIAQLGQDGWEMVGEGPLDVRAGSTNAIYFKRLRR